MSSMSGAKPWVTQRCSISPASATLSRSTSKRLLPGTGLAGLLHLAGGDVEDRLDRQQRAEERLGVPDPAALLQVVERVEGADDVGAAGEVLHQRDDLVDRRPRAPACAARSTWVPSPEVMECESRTRTSRSSAIAFAAFWADCIVADRSDERLMQTTASAPASRWRRKAASNLPGPARRSPAARTTRPASRRSSPR